MGGQIATGGDASSWRFPLVLGRRPSWQAMLLLLAAATYVYLLRRPASIATPAFWAEDGTVFFKAAFESGLGSLLEPYAGQVFVLQRAIAVAAGLLPVNVQPTLYTVAAVLIAVVACSFVLSSRWRFDVPILARYAVMIALLCSPSVEESFATLSNAHWWLAVGLLLVAMLHDPVTRSAKAGELVYVAATSVSGFAALYALPALAVRALRNRSRHSVALVAVAVAGLLVEVAVLLGSRRRDEIGAIGEISARADTAIVVFFRKIFGVATLGDGNLGVVWPTDAVRWWPWLIALSLAFAVAVVLARARSLEGLALAASIVGGWWLAIWASAGPGGLERLLWPGAAQRFFLIPIAAVFISLIIVTRRDLVTKSAVGIAAVLLAVGVLSDYRLPPLRYHDWPAFARCVERAEGVCSTTVLPDWPLVIDATRR